MNDATHPTDPFGGTAGIPGIPGPLLDPARSVPIAELVWRRPGQVTGRVRSVRVRPWGEAATLELVLVDDTGGVTVAFLGRRRLGGIRPGVELTVSGMVGAHREKLVIQNPVYLLAAADAG